MICWPSTDRPITTSLTTSPFWSAIWWYQSRRGMFGIAHVVGHGAGVRLHGRKTSKPWVGGVSGVLCADFARARAAFAGLVPVPETGSTFAPLARSAPASAAVAAMIVLPRAFGDEPSVRSKPCWASTDALVPLTEYWLTGGCGVSATAAAGA